MKIRSYIATCLFGCILGVLLYGTIVFSIQREFDIVHAMVVMLIGLGSSIAINGFLKRKHEKLYHSSNFKLTDLFFVQFNVFLGGVFGFFIGMFVSWVFFYPFALLFGHPESVKWSQTTSYSFQIIIFLIVFGSSGFFIVRFTQGAISYLRRKKNSGDVLQKTGTD